MVRDIARGLRDDLYEALGVIRWLLLPGLTIVHPLGIPACSLRHDCNEGFRISAECAAKPACECTKIIGGQWLRSDVVH